MGAKYENRYAIVLRANAHEGPVNTRLDRARNVAQQRSILWAPFSPFDDHRNYLRIAFTRQQCADLFDKRRDLMQAWAAVATRADFGANVVALS